MNTNHNITRRTVCGAILALAAVVAMVAAFVGCASLGGDSGERRQNIAAVIQAAYDMGGRAAVSNRIESLVAEGKLTPSQAARLHALAQLAYEGVMDDLTASDASDGGAPVATPDGDCNENADCGACADCTADE